MNYLFNVPGHPQPKERARKGKYGNFYTPQTTKDYEEKIRMAFLEQFKSKLDDRDHKWRLRVDIYFTGEKKFDGDNICKVVADALQAPRRKHKNLIGELKGCLWHNDNQIWDGGRPVFYKTGGNEYIVIIAEMMGRLE